MQDTISGSSIYVTAVSQSAWGGFTYRGERSWWKQTATPTNDNDRNRRGVVDATDSDTCSSDRSSARNGSVPIGAPESARLRRTVHAGRPVDPIDPSFFCNRFLGSSADGTHARWSTRYRPTIGSTRVESPCQRISFDFSTNLTHNEHRLVESMSGTHNEHRLVESMDGIRDDTPFSRHDGDPPSQRTTPQLSFNIEWSSPDQ